MTNETTENTTLTAEQILKSKQAFSDYVETQQGKISLEHAKNYPAATIHTTFAQLTQNIEGLHNFGELLNINADQYIFWVVVNEKEEILRIVKNLNGLFKKKCGIFVIKASLNDDKIEFNTILSPEIKAETKRKVNKDTPTKNLQMEYWLMYEELCDVSTCPDVQITPAQQHYQYIKTGKGCSQLLVTLNTQDSLATVEFVNTNDADKKIYNKLIASEAKIAKELKGIDLEWLELQGKKSSKIKTTIGINDINDREEWKTVIEQQIQIAEQFRTVITKYL